MVAWYWLNYDLVLFLCFARVNSRQSWYFRPGEPVSAKREYQKLFPVLSESPSCNVLAENYYLKINKK